MSTQVSAIQFTARAERRRHRWRIVPLTIAVCLGPVLDVFYVVGQAQVAVGGILSPFQLVNGLLLVLLISALPSPRMHLLTGRNVALPLMLLAVYTLVFAPIRPYPKEDIVLSFRLVLLYVCAVSALEFTRRGWLDSRWMLTIPWVLLGLLFASQVGGAVLGISGQGAYELAVTGISGRSSSVAVFAAAVLPWFLLQAYNMRAFVCANLILLAMSVASLRRSALLTVIGYLYVTSSYQVFTSHRLNRKIVLFLLLVSLPICLYVFCTVTPMGAALVERLEDLNVLEGGTASGRTVFMAVAINHLWKRDVTAMVFGEGTASIKDVLAEDYGSAIGSHNAWIDMTASCGLIGILCLLWFHVNIIRLIFQTIGRWKLASLGLATVVCLGGIIMGGMYAPIHTPLYVLLGMVSAQTARSRSMPLAELKTYRYRPCGRLYGRRKLFVFGNPEA